jgi:hypothetical protein
MRLREKKYRKHIVWHLLDQEKFSEDWIQFSQPIYYSVRRK